MMEFPNHIPKKHPFDLCMYFAGQENKVLGYFTYISYKDYKLGWIKDYKEKHNNKEPNKNQLDAFKENLQIKDYESFINNANNNITGVFSELLKKEMEKQLPSEIAKTNYEKISEQLRVCPASSEPKNIGNVIHELHTEASKKCKSFWMAILTSALGTVGLIVLFIILEIVFKTGLFQRMFDMIVPS